MSKREASGRAERVGVWLVTFVPDIADELVPVILSVLKSVEPYVGRWCRQIHVKFITNPAEDETDLNACVLSEVEYQRAVVKIFPAWLDLSKERRRETLLHEVCHTLDAELFDIAHTVIETLAPDDKTKEVLNELVRRAAESSCENIKEAILAAERKR